MRRTASITALTLGLLATGVAADRSLQSTNDLTSLGTQPLSPEEVGPMFESIQRHEQISVEKLHEALIGPQTALRADAARMLAERGDETSIPHLIHALTDDSMHGGARYPDPGMATTRYWAAESLRKMTGRNFGFQWDASQEARNTAVLRWSTWYQTVVAESSRKK